MRSGQFLFLHVSAFVILFNGFPFVYCLFDQETTHAVHEGQKRGSCLGLSSVYCNGSRGQKGKLFVDFFFSNHQLKHFHDNVFRIERYMRSDQFLFFPISVFIKLFNDCPFVSCMFDQETTHALHEALTDTVAIFMSKTTIHC